MQVRWGRALVVSFFVDRQTLAHLFHARNAQCALRETKKRGMVQL
jgi:hypothetical protein